MLFLFNLEWKKLYQLTAFRIFMAFYLLLLPSILLTGKQLKDLPPPLYTNEVFFMFPTVWQYLGYIGNWLCFFFFGFLAIIMVTTEYSNKTMRQNIITGLSRKQYFLSKFYFTVGISLFATLYFTLCALIIGFFNTEVIYWHKVWQYGDYIPRYFLMCLSYMTFGLLLGFLIRRTGLAMFLYLAYIMFVEQILRWGVHFQLFKHESMHFYPMNATEDLIPLPFTEMADEFISSYGFNIYIQPTAAMITVAIYVALFLFLAYNRIKSADL
jgi:ABC-2 type transport system permease protein